MNTIISPSSLSHDSITLIDAKIREAIHAYDAKEHDKHIANRKHHYNYHALPLYLAQADNVILDIQLGAPVRAAIIAGFNGRLCDAILRNLKIQTTIVTERRGSGIYQPISKNHPEA